MQDQPELQTDITLRQLLRHIVRALPFILAVLIAVFSFGHVFLGNRQQSVAKFSFIENLDRTDMIECPVSLLIQSDAFYQQFIQVCDLDNVFKKYSTRENSVRKWIDSIVKITIDKSELSYVVYSVQITTDNPKLSTKMAECYYQIVITSMEDARHTYYANKLNQIETQIEQSKLKAQQIGLSDQKIDSSLYATLIKDYVTVQTSMNDNLVPLVQQVNKDIQLSTVASPSNIEIALVAILAGCFFGSFLYIIFLFIRNKKTKKT